MKCHGNCNFESYFKEERSNIPAWIEVFQNANAHELSNFMSASKCIELVAQYRLFRKGLVPLNLVTYLCQAKITRSL